MRNFGIVAGIVLGLFVFGVVAAWLGPQERVTAVNGTSIVCQERFHTDHTKTIAVSKAVAETTDVGDRCPA